MAELKKKYGLLTAICMVIGIVVGSGVFFKAESILNYRGLVFVHNLLPHPHDGSCLAFCKIHTCAHLR